LVSIGTSREANGVRHMDRSDAVSCIAKAVRRKCSRWLRDGVCSQGAGGLAIVATARPGFAETPAVNDLTERRNGTMDINVTAHGLRAKAPRPFHRHGPRGPVFQVGEPARVSGGHVTFKPGARSAWHTHPLGQTLIVTSGLGWAQCEGGPIEEIRPGDVIWFPPGEKQLAGARRRRPQ